MELAEHAALQQSPEAFDGVGVNVPSRMSTPQTRKFRKENRTQAEQYGISPATIAVAFRGIRPLDRLLKQDRKQAEYSKTFFEYLHGRVSNSLISNGRARIKQNRTLLANLEAKYGVPPEILVALWGLESGLRCRDGQYTCDRCPEHSGLR